MNMKKLLPFFITAMMLVVSCNDEDPVVLDGISIGDAVTLFKFSEINISDIEATSAALEVTLTEQDPDYQLENTGFVWSSTNNSPNINNDPFSVLSSQSANLDTIGTIRELITGLEPDQTYFVRAYVETDRGVGYGRLFSFNTETAVAETIVLNEGNFQSGDGSISLYSSVSQEVQLSAFASANGFPIGATVQQGIVHQGQIYLTTNAPDKLEAIDEESLVSTGFINDGFTNPYGIAANGNKAYVTNWGTLNFETFAYEDSYISVIDLDNLTITKRIDRAKQPQNIVYLDGYFYISEPGSNTVSVFDEETDAEHTIVYMSPGPDQMVVDENKNIWVLCRSGNLSRINTGTFLVDKNISGVEVYGFNEKMVINQTGDQLYYLSSTGFNPSEGAIWTVNISEEQAPEEPIITGDNFYAVGISPEGDIYVGDNNGFQGNGSVLVYNGAGELQTTFATGRGPNGFLFRFQ
jgi:hypothetical protein